ncbi:addiction module protein [Cerasicoccus fimbriatus]|uniref:addiction module protein n=1 Tax=Cerasicoccus fimbriatus TaxID=3014554 RepID=UPI0022B5B795|nr:addiction module protein [Cerasicoccus sp. TK19100]
MKLSAADREALANYLLQSVHNAELNELDTEWIAVAEERFNALVSGKDSGIPEKDFFQRFENA